MSRNDREPPVEQDFELVSDRYVFVPVLLWVAAMLVALLGVLTSPGAESHRASSPIGTEAATVAFGA